MAISDLFCFNPGDSLGSNDDGHGELALGESGNVVGQVGHGEVGVVVKSELLLEQVVGNRKSPVIGLQGQLIPAVPFA